MRADSTRPARTGTELDRIVIWVAGGCAAAGAAGGFFVGFVYTLDQGDRALALLYGALGLFLGAILGLINAIAPVVALAAVNGRRWLSPTPLRAVLAAVAAVVPLAAVNLLLTSEPDLGFVGLCALLTAVPAGAATICLDWRTLVLARSH